MDEFVHNLVSYHLNPIKTGKIIQQMREEADESTSSLAKRIGESYDVVNNIQHGRGGLTFERAIKICAAYRFSLESFMRLALKDDKLDFWKDIMLYDMSNGKLIPMTDPNVSDVPFHVSETMATVATVSADVHFDPSATSPSREEMQAQFSRQAALYEANIADLHAYIESLERTNQLLTDLLGRK